MPPKGVRDRRRTERWTERQFQQQIIQLAKYLGWLVYHTYDSRRSEAGFPDLVLVHRKKKKTLFAELKVGDNQPTKDQVLWLLTLDQAGQWSELWHPDQWHRIEHILKTGQCPSPTTNPPQKEKKK